MRTDFMLLAQYDGLSVIPVSVVCRDYFHHLTPEKFIRKISLGEIKLPMMRMDASQKSSKGVHIHDLAKYLDDRRAEAQKDAARMQ